MRHPSIRTPESLRQWTEMKLDSDTGKWVLARPIPYPSFMFWWRVHLAFMVFTGKYDALKWAADQ